MNVIKLSATLTTQGASGAAQALDPAADLSQPGAVASPLSSLFASLLARQVGTAPATGKELSDSEAAAKEKPGLESAQDALLASLQQVVPVDPSMQLQQAAASAQGVAQAPATTESPAENAVQDVLSGEAGERERPGVRNAYGHPAEGESHGEVRRQQVAANAAAFAAPERVLPDQAQGRAADGQGGLKSGMAKPDAIQPDALQQKPIVATTVQDQSLQSGTSGIPVAQQAAPVAVMAAAQAAPAQQPQPLQAAPISPTVGHSAWGEALGDRVVWMVSQQHQGVEMHLNPPSLGPLEVRLTMNDGQANLSFNTQHLPVKEAIESATPRLREMLGDSGINLGSVSVNVGSFSQPQQQAGQQNPSAARPQMGAWAEFMPSADFSDALPSAATRIRSDGMVDLFA